MSMQGYSAATVANNFLERAAREGRSLTPMQLLKLVYISHAFNLGYGYGPLINEPVEAWRYGPVVRSLYNQVREYGGSPVTELLQTGHYIWDRDSQVDARSESVLENVWRSYGHFDGYRLSDMTHMPGSPWWVTWNELGGRNQISAVIDDNLIREFYESKLRFWQTRLEEPTAELGGRRQPALG